MAAAVPWSHEMRAYSAGTEAGSGFVGLHAVAARNPTRPKRMLKQWGEGFGGRAKVGSSQPKPEAPKHYSRNLQT